MSEWKEYRLGDISEYINRGITPSYSDSGIVVLNQKCIRDGYVKYQQSRFTSTEKKGYSIDKFLKSFDILINSTGQGTLGRVGQVKEIVTPTTVDSHVTIVRINKLHNPIFIGYVLKSKQQFIEQLAEGTTGQTELSRHKVAEISFRLPDLPTQIAIAEILSSLDDKIELNNKINLELEALAQTLFKRWFVDFEFPNQNGEPYKSAGGEMVDSELGEIPKGWRVSKFKDCIDVNRGLSYKGTGLTDITSGIPMINLNSVFEGGGYKKEGIKYYNGNYKESHLIHPWDIAVTNTEQGHKYLLIGYPAFVPKFIGSKAIYSHHIFKVNAKLTSYLTNQFIYYLIKQPRIREQIIGACNGTTVNMLKVIGLESPVFILPPKQLVSAYSDLVSNVWDSYEINTIESKKLTNLRDTLLPKLISGELEVS